MKSIISDMYVFDYSIIPIQAEQMCKSKTQIVLCWIFVISCTVPTCYSDTTDDCLLLYNITHPYYVDFGRIGNFPLLTLLSQRKQARSLLLLL